VSTIQQLQELLAARIAEFQYPGKTETLFAPVEYYMASGGKRIRPALSLMACELFGGDAEEALPAALAIEVFHNFSLLHDDVMDNAPLRRGQDAAHVKWNVNQALLSGDAMLVYAYQLLADLPAEILPQTLEVFNRTAVEVCEGQQLDMEFEEDDDVALSLYLEMIRLKTSALLNGAMQLGAIVAGADSQQREDIGKFGEHLGMAFQLMDDYLDAFGGEDFGKVQGGDILADKKTYLAIRTREKADPALWQSYTDTMTNKVISDEEKVGKIKEIMRAVGSDNDLLKLSAEYSERATNLLDNLDVPAEFKRPLQELSGVLLQRTT
jgi:geranylgeranyl diphosphate synthase type II